MPSAVGSPPGRPHDQVGFQGLFVSLPATRVACALPVHIFIANHHASRLTAQCPTHLLLEQKMHRGHGCGRLKAPAGQGLLAATSAIQTARAPLSLPSQAWLSQMNCFAFEKALSHWLQCLAAPRGGVLLRRKASTAQMIDASLLGDTEASGRCPQPKRPSLSPPSVEAKELKTSTLEIKFKAHQAWQALSQPLICQASERTQSVPAFLLSANPGG